MDACPGFIKRMQWLLDHHPEVADQMDASVRCEKGVRRLLALGE